MDYLKRLIGGKDYDATVVELLGRLPEISSNRALQSQVVTLERSSDVQMRSKGEQIRALSMLAHRLEDNKPEDVVQDSIRLLLSKMNPDMPLKDAGKGPGDRSQKAREVRGSSRSHEPRGMDEEESSSPSTRPGSSESSGGDGGRAKGKSEVLAGDEKKEFGGTDDGTDTKKDEIDEGADKRGVDDDRLDDFSDWAAAVSAIPCAAGMRVPLWRSEHACQLLVSAANRFGGKTRLLVFAAFRMYMDPDLPEKNGLQIAEWIGCSLDRLELPEWIPFKSKIEETWQTLIERSSVKLRVLAFSQSAEFPNDIRVRLTKNRVWLPAVDILREQKPVEWLVRPALEGYVGSTTVEIGPQRQWDALEIQSDQLGSAHTTIDDVARADQVRMHSGVLVDGNEWLNNPDWLQHCAGVTGDSSIEELEVARLILSIIRSKSLADLESYGLKDDGWKLLDRLCLVPLSRARELVDIRGSSLAIPLVTWITRQRPSERMAAALLAATPFLVKNERACSSLASALPSDPPRMNKREISSADLQILQSCLDVARSSRDDGGEDDEVDHTNSPAFRALAARAFTIVALDIVLDPSVGEHGDYDNLAGRWRWIQERARPDVVREAAFVFVERVAQLVDLSNTVRYLRTQEALVNALLSLVEENILDGTSLTPYVYEFYVDLVSEERFREVFNTVVGRNHRFEDLIPYLERKERKEDEEAPDENHIHRNGLLLLEVVHGRCNRNTMKDRYVIANHVCSSALAVRPREVFQAAEELGKILRDSSSKGDMAWVEEGNRDGEPGFKEVVFHALVAPPDMSENMLMSIRGALRHLELLSSAKQSDACLEVAIARILFNSRGQGDDEARGQGDDEGPGLSAFHHRALLLQAEEPNLKDSVQLCSAAAIAGHQLEEKHRILPSISEWIKRSWKQVWDVLRDQDQLQLGNVYNWSNALLDEDAYGGGVALGDIFRLPLIPALETAAETVTRIHHPVYLVRLAMAHLRSTLPASSAAVQRAEREVFDISSTILALPNTIGEAQIAAAEIHDVVDSCVQLLAFSRAALTQLPAVTWSRLVEKNSERNALKLLSEAMEVTFGFLACVFDEKKKKKSVLDSGDIDDLRLLVRGSEYVEDAPTVEETDVFPKDILRASLVVVALRKQWPEVPRDLHRPELPMCPRLLDTIRHLANIRLWNPDTLQVERLAVDSGAGHREVPKVSDACTVRASLGDVVCELLPPRVPIFSDGLLSERDEKVQSVSAFIYSILEGDLVVRVQEAVNSLAQLAAAARGVDEAPPKVTNLGMDVLVARSRAVVDATKAEAPAVRLASAIANVSPYLVMKSFQVADELTTEGSPEDVSNHCNDILRRESIRNLDRSGAVHTALRVLRPFLLDLRTAILELGLGLDTPALDIAEELARLPILQGVSDDEIHAAAVAIGRSQDVIDAIHSVEKGAAEANARRDAAVMARTGCFVIGAPQELSAKSIPAHVVFVLPSDAADCQLIPVRFCRRLCQENPRTSVVISVVIALPGHPPLVDVHASSAQSIVAVAGGSSQLTELPRCSITDAISLVFAASPHHKRVVINATRQEFRLEVLSGTGSVTTATFDLEGQGRGHGAYSDVNALYLHLKPSLQVDSRKPNQTRELRREASADSTGGEGGAGAAEGAAAPDGTDPERVLNDADAAHDEEEHGGASSSSVAFGRGNGNVGSTEVLAAEVHFCAVADPQWRSSCQACAKGERMVQWSDGGVGAKELDAWIKGMHFRLGGGDVAASVIRWPQSEEDNTEASDSDQQAAVFIVRSLKRTVADVQRATTMLDCMVLEGHPLSVALCGIGRGRSPHCLTLDGTGCVRRNGRVFLECDENAVLRIMATCNTQDLSTLGTESDLPPQHRMNLAFLEGSVSTGLLVRRAAQMQAGAERLFAWAQGERDAWRSRLLDSGAPLLHVPLRRFWVLAERLDRAFRAITSDDVVEDPRGGEEVRTREQLQNWARDVRSFVAGPLRFEDDREVERVAGAALNGAADSLSSGDSDGDFSQAHTLLESAVSQFVDPQVSERAPWRLVGEIVSKVRNEVSEARRQKAEEVNRELQKNIEILDRSIAHAHIEGPPQLARVPSGEPCVMHFRRALHEDAGVYCSTAVSALLRLLAAEGQRPYAAHLLFCDTYTHVSDLVGFILRAAALTRQWQHEQVSHDPKSLESGAPIFVVAFPDVLQASAQRLLVDLVRQACRTAGGRHEQVPLRFVFLLPEIVHLSSSHPLDARFTHVEDQNLLMWRPSSIPGDRTQAFASLPVVAVPDVALPRLHELYAAACAHQSCTVVRSLLPRSGKTRAIRLCASHASQRFRLAGPMTRAQLARQMANRPSDVCVLDLRPVENQSTLEAVLGELLLTGSLFDPLRGKRTVLSSTQLWIEVGNTYGDALFRATGLLDLIPHTIPTQATIRDLSQAVRDRPHKLITIRSALCDPLVRTSTVHPDDVPLEAFGVEEALGTVDEATGLACPRSPAWQRVIDVVNAELGVDDGSAMRTLCRLLRQTRVIPEHDVPYANESIILDSLTSTTDIAMSAEVVVTEAGFGATENVARVEGSDRPPTENMRPISHGHLREVLRLFAARMALLHRKGSEAPIIARRTLLQMRRRLWRPAIALGVGTHMAGPWMLNDLNHSWSGVGDVSLLEDIARENRPEKQVRVRATWDRASFPEIWKEGTGKRADGTSILEYLDGEELRNLYVKLLEQDDLEELEPFRGGSSKVPSPQVSAMLTAMGCVLPSRTKDPVNEAVYNQEMDIREPSRGRPFVITPLGLLRGCELGSRLAAGSGVALMGPAGVGKTLLVQALGLLSGALVHAQHGESPLLEVSSAGFKYAAKFLGKIVPGQFIIKVDAGTTQQNILQVVSEAVSWSQEMEGETAMLVFDEANTTPHLPFISEVLLDRTLFGIPLQDLGSRPEVAPSLRIVACCNPHQRPPGRKRGPLQYSVVECLPELGTVFLDFGEQLTIDPSLAEEYILAQSMIQAVLRNAGEDIGEEIIELLLPSTMAAQRAWHEHRRTSMPVSLRQVHDVVELTIAVHKERCLLHLGADAAVRAEFAKSPVEIARACALAIWLVYIVRCPSRGEQSRSMDIDVGAPSREELEEQVFDVFAERLRDYHDSLTLDEVFPCEPGAALSERLHQLLFTESEAILEMATLGESIARNRALRTNVVATWFAVHAGIPILLVGSPGCSKSLAVSVVTNILHGKGWPLYSFQGSKQATSEGIHRAFNDARNGLDVSAIERGKRSIVLLDEIGLAERSEHNPLKVLHAKLEDARETMGEASRFGTSAPLSVIAISNHVLDAAKMSRMLTVACADLNADSLARTANRILLGMQAEQLDLDGLARRFLLFAEGLQKSHRGLATTRCFYAFAKAVALRRREVERWIEERETLPPYRSYCMGLRLDQKNIALRRMVRLLMLEHFGSPGRWTGLSARELGLPAAEESERDIDPLTALLPSREAATEGEQELLGTLEDAEDDLAESGVGPLGTSSLWEDILIDDLLQKEMLGFRRDELVEPTRGRHVLLVTRGAPQDAAAALLQRTWRPLQTRLRTSYAGVGVVERAEHVIVGSPHREDLEATMHEMSTQLRGAMQNGALTVLLHGEPILEGFFDVLNQNYKRPARENGSFLGRIAVDAVTNALEIVSDGFRVVAVTDEASAWAMDPATLSRFAVVPAETAPNLAKLRSIGWLPKIWPAGTRSADVVASVFDEDDQVLAAEAALCILPRALVTNRKEFHVEQRDARASLAVRRAMASGLAEQSLKGQMLTMFGADKHRRKRKVIPVAGDLVHVLRSLAQLRGDANSSTLVEELKGGSRGGRGGACVTRLVAHVDSSSLGMKDPKMLASFLSEHLEAITANVDCIFVEDFATSAELGRALQAAVSQSLARYGQLSVIVALSDTKVVGEPRDVRIRVLIEDAASQAEMSARGMEDPGSVIIVLLQPYAPNTENGRGRQVAEIAKCACEATSEEEGSLATCSLTLSSGADENFPAKEFEKMLREQLLNSDVHVVHAQSSSTDHYATELSEKILGSMERERDCTAVAFFEGKKWTQRDESSEAGDMSRLDRFRDLVERRVGDCGRQFRRVLVLVNLTLAEHQLVPLWELGPSLYPLLGSNSSQPWIQVVVDSLWAPRYFAPSLRAMATSSQYAVCNLVGVSAEETLLEPDRTAAAIADAVGDDHLLGRAARNRLLSEKFVGPELSRRVVQALGNMMEGGKRRRAHLGVDGVEDEAVAKDRREKIAKSAKTNAVELFAKGRNEEMQTIVRKGSVVREIHEFVQRLVREFGRDAKQVFSQWLVTDSLIRVAASPSDSKWALVRANQAALLFEERRSVILQEGARSAPKSSAMGGTKLLLPLSSPLWHFTRCGSFGDGDSTSSGFPPIPFHWHVMRASGYDHAWDLGNQARYLESMCPSISAVFRSKGGDESRRRAIDAFLQMRLPLVLDRRELAAGGAADGLMAVEMARSESSSPSLDGDGADGECAVALQALEEAASWAPGARKLQNVLLLSGLGIAREEVGHEVLALVTHPLVHDAGCLVATEIPSYLFPEATYEARRRQAASAGVALTMSVLALEAARTRDRRVATSGAAWTWIFAASRCCGPATASLIGGISLLMLHNDWTSEEVAANIVESGVPFDAENFAACDSDTRDVRATHAVTIAVAVSSLLCRKVIDAVRNVLESNDPVLERGEMESNLQRCLLPMLQQIAHTVRLLADEDANSSIPSSLALVRCLRYSAHAWLATDLLDTIVTDRGAPSSILAVARILSKSSEALSIPLHRNPIASLELVKAARAVLRDPAIRPNERAALQILHRTASLVGLERGLVATGRDPPPMPTNTKYLDRLRGFGHLPASLEDSLEIITEAALISPDPDIFDRLRPFAVVREPVRMAVRAFEHLRGSRVPRFPREEIDPSVILLGSALATEFARLQHTDGPLARAVVAATNSVLRQTPETGDEQGPLLVPEDLNLDLARSAEIWYLGGVHTTYENNERFMENAARAVRVLDVGADDVEDQFSFVTVSPQGDLVAVVTSNAVRILYPDGSSGAVIGGQEGLGDAFEPTFARWVLNNALVGPHLAIGSASRGSIVIARLSEDASEVQSVVAIETPNLSLCGMTLLDEDRLVGIWDDPGTDIGIAYVLELCIQDEDDSLSVRRIMTRRVERVRALCALGKNFAICDRSGCLRKLSSDRWECAESNVLVARPLEDEEEDEEEAHVAIGDKSVKIEASPNGTWLFALSERTLRVVTAQDFGHVVVEMRGIYAAVWSGDEFLLAANEQGRISRVRMSAPEHAPIAETCSVPSCEPAPRSMAILPQTGACVSVANRRCRISAFQPPQPENLVLGMIGAVVVRDSLARLNSAADLARVRCFARRDIRVHTEGDGQELECFPIFFQWVRQLPSEAMQTEAVSEISEMEEISEELRSVCVSLQEGGSRPCLSSSPGLARRDRETILIVERMGNGGDVPLHEEEADPPDEEEEADEVDAGQGGNALREAATSDDLDRRMAATLAVLRSCALFAHTESGLNRSRAVRDWAEPLVERHPSLRAIHALAVAAQDENHLLRLDVPRPRGIPPQLRGIVAHLGALICGASGSNSFLGDLFFLASDPLVLENGFVPAVSSEIFYSEREAAAAGRRDAIWFCNNCKRTFDVPPCGVPTDTRTCETPGCGKTVGHRRNGRHNDMVDGTILIRAAPGTFAHNCLQDFVQMSSQEVADQPVGYRPVDDAIEILPEKGRMLEDVESLEEQGWLREKLDAWQLQRNQARYSASESRVLRIIIDATILFSEAANIAPPGRLDRCMDRPHTWWLPRAVQPRFRLVEFSLFRALRSLQRQLHLESLDDAALIVHAVLRQLRDRSDAESGGFRTCRARAVWERRMVEEFIRPHLHNPIETVAAEKQEQAAASRALAPSIANRFVLPETSELSRMSRTCFLPDCESVTLQEDRISTNADLVEHLIRSISLRGRTRASILAEAGSQAAQQSIRIAAQVFPLVKLSMVVCMSDNEELRRMTSIPGEDWFDREPDLESGTSEHTIEEIRQLRKAAEKAWNFLQDQEVAMNPGMVIPRLEFSLRSFRIGALPNAREVAHLERLIAFACRQQSLVVRSILARAREIGKWSHVVPDEFEICEAAGLTVQASELSEDLALVTLHDPFSSHNEVVDMYWSNIARQTAYRSVKPFGGDISFDLDLAEEMVAADILTRIRPLKRIILRPGNYRQVLFEGLSNLGEGFAVPLERTDRIVLSKSLTKLGIEQLEATVNTLHWLVQQVRGGRTFDGRIGDGLRSYVSDGIKTIGVCHLQAVAMIVEAEWLGRQGARENAELRMPLVGVLNTVSEDPFGGDDAAVLEVATRLDGGPELVLTEVAAAAGRFLYRLRFDGPDDDPDFDAQFSDDETLQQFYEAGEKELELVVNMGSHTTYHTSASLFPPWTRADGPRWAAALVEAALPEGTQLEGSVSFYRALCRARQTFFDEILQ